MSEIEAPPTTLPKVQDGEYMGGEGESIEEGQEEWLSEGVLTDDDYHEMDQDRTNIDLGNASQLSQEDPDATPSLDNSMEDVETLDDQILQNDSIDHVEYGSNTGMDILAANTENIKMDDPDTNSQQDIPNQDDTSVSQPTLTSKETQGTGKELVDIEEALNNLESAKNGIPPDLDAFLIRKTDGAVLEKLPNAEVKKAKSEDDGNDTDDLLRLLEDDEKPKRLVKRLEKNTNEHTSDDDDDEFVYEPSKVTTLKVAKNAVIRKYAKKAEPEETSDRDDTDGSSNDAQITVKKIFGVQKRSFASKSTAKPATHEKPGIKRISFANENSNTRTISHPAQYKKINIQENKAAGYVTNTSKSAGRSDSINHSNLHQNKIDVHSEVKESIVRDDDEIEEEEFLEDADDFDLDEDFAEDSELDESSSKRQRIMRPETMEEDVPSDEDSHTEDGSLYDELPSSDSEDLDDWFELDIRAERAGDYLPYLGTKAKELLLEEKRRTTARLNSLRKSLSALTESARKQADQLREATMTLAELDDMLKAT